MAIKCSLHLALSFHIKGRPTGIAFLTEQSVKVSAFLPDAWSLDWALGMDGTWYTTDAARPIARTIGRHARMRPHQGAPTIRTKTHLQILQVGSRTLFDELGDLVEDIA